MITWNFLLSSNPVSAAVTGQDGSALETHRASLKHLRMLRSWALAQVQLTPGRDFKGWSALRANRYEALGERSHRPPTFSISVYLREQRGRAHYAAFETYVHAHVKVSVCGGCVSGCIRGSECAGQVCGDADSGGRASHRVTGPGHSQSLCSGLVSTHLAGMPTCIN